MATTSVVHNNFARFNLDISNSRNSQQQYNAFLDFRKARRSPSPLTATTRSSYAQTGNDAFGNLRRGNDSNIYYKAYTRRDSCVVVPPKGGKKPKALIKFLGGAFIGAVPEVTYSYLLGLLANEGYLIVSVPYNVTFDHERVTRDIFERFHTCLDLLLTDGLPENGISGAEIADLPFYSVGHSNGALLQVLTGSYFNEKIPQANAIISYNNRPASEAVPYFEQLGPTVKQMMPLIETSPILSMTQTLSGDGLKTLLDLAERVIPDYDPEAVVSLTKFIDQLPSVFNQVAEGISEFKPTPAENLECFKNLYSIQNTLLVKFDVDAIDETDLLEQTLRPRVESYGGKFEKVILRGTHITPCTPELKWQVGPVYTPADAVAQGLKALSLYDIKVLSRTISNWFDGL